jgi:hypothetical protein
MHTSWLVTLFLRMSKHESMIIRRWAVTTVLTLDYSVCPLLWQSDVKVNNLDFFPEMTISAGMSRNAVL